MAKKPITDIEKMKKRLEARRTEIDALIRQSVGTHANIDLEEGGSGRLTRMDAIQQHAMEDETVRRREKELSRIDLALERIASGDYGFCTACDEPIAVKRLENDPATPFCINCASKAEMPPEAG